MELWLLMSRHLSCATPALAPCLPVSCSGGLLCSSKCMCDGSMVLHEPRLIFLLLERYLVLKHSSFCCNSMSFNLLLLHQQQQRADGVQEGMASKQVLGTLGQQVR